MDTHKHVVFFCLDAPGHINPLVTIADELHARLHKTTFVTQYPLSFAEQLRERGHHVHHCIEPPSTATPVTSNHSTIKAQQQEDDNSKPASTIVGSLSATFREGPFKTFEATYARNGVAWRYHEDIKGNHSTIEAKLRSLQPDILIVDHVVGVPCATYVAPRWIRFFSSFPLILYSSCNRRMAAGPGLSLEQMPDFKEQELAIKAPLRQSIREFFRAHNLNDWPSLVDLAPSSPYLNFYMGPRELGFESMCHINQLPSYWTQCEQLVRHDDDQIFEIPEELSQQSGKLIYMSLGTLVSGDIQLMQRLLTFLSHSPHRFIVSMGASHDKLTLGNNMWGARHLPQTLILPQIDLCITHGGHNTIIECFYFGVPGLVVMPVFADQFDCAQRIHDLDFGVRLNPLECTQDELLGCIEKLLVNDSLRERMRCIGERLRSTECAREAVNKIESLMGL